MENPNSLVINFNNSVYILHVYKTTFSITLNSEKRIFKKSDITYGKEILIKDLEIYRSPINPETIILEIKPVLVIGI